MRTSAITRSREETLHFRRANACSRSAQTPMIPALLAKGLGIDLSRRAVGMAALFFSVAPVSIFAAFADDADTFVKGSGDEKSLPASPRSFRANGKAVISPGPIPTGDVRITRRRTTPTRSPTRLRRSGQSRGADAYICRGWAYDGKEDYAHAIADETEAIRLNPEDANAYIYRGWAYDDTDQFDRAIADETKAIQLRPGDRAVFNNRGTPIRQAGIRCGHRRFHRGDTD